MTDRWSAVALLVAWTTPAAPAQAQWTTELLAEETAGIRRTAFPARVDVEIPAGRLHDAGRVRLVEAGGEVTVQGTARATWPDGSVRALSVTFNLSLGPLEARTLTLRYGADVPRTEPLPRGLAVAEAADGLEVGRLGLGRVAPVLRSVAYREELVVAGRNGVAVLDDLGVWHRTDEFVWQPVEVVERGPLTVLLAYRGRLQLAPGRVADVALQLELPNSKSWLKISASATSPDGGLHALAIESPLHLGAYPWTWDFGTPNGTYGAFRDPAASAVLTLDTATGAWRVLTGPAGEERPYEVGARSGPAAGAWAHLVGEREAVAFALDPGGVAGTLTARLDGSGQTMFELAPSQPGPMLALTLYQHYVSTPVPIGAATSPASILSPLRVTAR
jgi:hypothetical protein